MVKMAFREKIKLFPNAPGCALSQKNTKKIIPVGHFQGMVEGQAPLWHGHGVRVVSRMFTFYDNVVGLDN